ncbi:hypothetical protein OE766_05800 [Pararhizobium sp. YC-54]|uniref:hypothetical protein n=1 Tax=Pararhizobium sp. YC-54 TaxID=2986920 RepID=UPI0021F6F036|nr:hypothetical protein [Pararhizobium sp. YC-54]MCV9997754.1 hypothetical protein [Pararhizobium sp. YC-54]
MTSDLDFDPALFGLWPKAPVYDGVLRQEADAALEDAARRVILETKAKPASPLDDLQDMLNGMTRELREQMAQFQRLRRIAGGKAEAAGDDIDRKLIQADAKASIEAMSVIVRTLEKIDSLQRTIAHDRQMMAEQDFDQVGFEKLQAEFEARIESRAQDIAREREQERAREAAVKGAEAERSSAERAIGDAKSSGPS